jgi:hypothetical protein
MVTATKELAVGLGFGWVRENVTKVYGRTILDQLTGDEIQVVHAKALADAAA